MNLPVLLDVSLGWHLTHKFYNLLVTDYVYFAAHLRHFTGSDFPLLGFGQCLYMTLIGQQGY